MTKRRGTRTAQAETIAGYQTADAPPDAEKWPTLRDLAVLELAVAHTVTRARGSAAKARSARARAERASTAAQEQPESEPLLDVARISNEAAPRPRHDRRRTRRRHPGPVDHRGQGLRPGPLHADISPHVWFRRLRSGFRRVARDGPTVRAPVLWTVAAILGLGRGQSPWAVPPRGSRPGGP